MVLNHYTSAGPLSLHSKPLRSPSLWQCFFDYWKIRFGRFFAWTPQPSRQEAYCKLRSAADWRHQNQI